MKGITKTILLIKVGTYQSGLKLNLKTEKFHGLFNTKAILIEEQ